MITIPRSEREAFQSSAPKNLTLNFPYRDPITNENIYMESAQLEQSICEENNLTFGMVYSSRFSVRIFDNGESYIGVRVNPRLSVTVDDRTFERSLGYYSIKSDKLTSDKLYRDLDCYDYLEDVLPVDFHEWHNNRPNTFTLKQYRDAFFAYIELEQVPITLPNDNVTLNKFNVTEFSGADILSCILQLSGAFGFIAIDGRFKYVIPKTSSDYLIDDGSYVQGSFNYEDEPMEPITQVIIKGFSDDYGEEGSYSVADASMGDTTGNVFTIENNNLIQSCPLATRQLLCSNLYYAIRNYSYYPSSVDLPAYIGLEPGDVFTIETDRKTVTFPVFKRTLKGISALKDSVEAPGEVNLTTNVNMVGTGVSSVQRALDQVRESVAELLAQKASIAAQDAAIAANIAANGALTQLSIVQDVAGTLNWIREHGTFVLTEDTVIDPNTVYFIYENGEYTPIVSPDPNLNPSEEGWYVLDVTSSQSDYIMAHLAVTEAGLWVLPFNTLAPHPLVDSDDNDLIDSNDNYLVDWSRDPQYSTGYKVLLSNNGMTVYDSFGVAIANYGETITIGSQLYYNAFIDNQGMKIRYGSKNLASYGSSTIFYKPDGVTKAVEIDSNGIDIKTGHIGGFLITEGISLSRNVSYDGVNWNTLALDQCGINFNNKAGLISYDNNTLYLEAPQIQFEMNWNGDVAITYHSIFMENEQYSCSNGVTSNSGDIYLFSNGTNATYDYRGVYTYNGETSKYVITVDGSNYTYFYGTAQAVSDLKKKEVIDDYDWQVDDFIRGLKPIAYYKKHEDGTTGDRIHYGFGAQDVKALVDKLQMDELGAYNAKRITIDEDGCKHEDGDYHGEKIDDSELAWGLVYDEFVAPMVLEIQRLMKRVDELEAKIEEMGG